MGQVVPSAVGFSGRIKSGKTTISQGTAHALRWPRVSFGDYVRAVASSRGLDTSSRCVLQEVGESLIEEGWLTFCSNVLAAAAWTPGQPVVIDGIRHVEALQHLRDLVSPLPLRHVHVSIGDEERAARLDGAASESTMRELESHSTEVQVKSELAQIADLVIDGDAEIDANVAAICAMLSEGTQSV